MLPSKALRNWLTVLIFIFLVLISGCATLGQVETQKIKPLKPEALPSGNGWWYARFRMNWPADAEPIWYMDLYLAHQVILPILETYQNDILLWRFHRRAARDSHGRQFSFIFYSTPQTARNIFHALETDPLVNTMKFADVIVKDVYDNPAKITRPNIEDTSDKRWPPSIRKTWPYYIMGVSQMWLNLISEAAEDHLDGDPPSSLQQIKAFYRQVNKRVIALWQKEGRHAFMHHLNALFGYEPLIYWEKRYLTF